MSQLSIPRLAQPQAFEPQVTGWPQGDRPERVFFVRRGDVARGTYPAAKPVVLVDASLAHRYVGVHALVVVDCPVGESVMADDARPVFVVNLREAVLYEDACPATIVADQRRADAHDRGH